MAVYHRKNEIADDVGGSSAVDTVFEWVDSFVITLIFVVLILTFFICKVEVSGNSMQSTLEDKDQLMITDFNYKPKNGDIVIISRNYSNLEKDAQTADKPIVKRVIATEGQSVEIKDGSVYIDDKKIDEPYLDPNIVTDGTIPRDFVGKHTVPAGCVFVLGDNRPISHDSRKSDIGFVNEKYILGKVLFRIYPFDSVKSFIE